MIEEDGEQGIVSQLGHVAWAALQGERWAGMRVVDSCTMWESLSPPPAGTWISIAFLSAV